MPPTSTLLRLLIASALVPPMAPTAVESREVAYRAEAFDLATGELVYVEQHRESWQGENILRHQVQYVGPAGDVIAEKEIRYDRLTTPSFEMVDLRSGAREGARIAGEKLELFTSDEAGRPLLRREVRLSEAAVVDAGFHRFVQAEWERLTAGETVEFEFAVPSERRFISFRVRPIGETRFEGEPALRFQMQIANPLFRLLLDPIELTYSADRRLLVYEGISNIDDGAGGKHRARIVFDYSSGPGAFDSAGAMTSR